MATALIFAGGTGRRMNSSTKPKQFIEMNGKPIIIYTLEHFEFHPEIEHIVIVCLKDWISELQGMLSRYKITKVRIVTEGGETGHDSVYLGLAAMKNLVSDDEIVLIHDGVRPFISEELITLNIEMVKLYGNAITSEPARESVFRSIDGEKISEVPERNQMYTAKAPQSFRYGTIYRIYEQAKRDGVKSIDSAHLCSLYNEPMHLIKSTPNNLKITEPADYYIYKALIENKESQQIFGV